MNKTILCAIIVLTSTLGLSNFAENPHVGHWALTIPGGGPGWLGIEEVDGGLQASILWGGGSVKPVTSVKVNGDQLVNSSLSRLDLMARVRGAARVQRQNGRQHAGRGSPPESRIDEVNDAEDAAAELPVDRVFAVGDQSAERNDSPSGRANDDLVAVTTDGPSIDIDAVDELLSTVDDLPGLV